MLNKPPKYKLKKSISVKTKRQILLFLLVGALNTLFGYMCFAVCIYFGLHYTVAVLLATSLGILFNFNTTGRIVFNNVQGNLIIKFIGVYAFLYILNISLLTFLQIFLSNYYITGLVAIFPVATVAFILNKYFVFGETDEIN